MKKTSWLNQKVEEAICAKKVAYKTGLQISHQLNFVRITLIHVWRQPQKLNCLRKRAWKEFGERLDDDFKMANKVFWRTIYRLRGKGSQPLFSLKV